MKSISKLTIAGGCLAGSLWLAGCATPQYVDQKVAGVQGQVSDLQGQLHDQDGRITTADSTAQEALARAEAAGKLAQGKFMYSVVLSDDDTKFPVNGSALSSDAQTKLSAFVDKLRSDNLPVYVEIQGYTDSTGSPAGNERLGADRAEAVRLYLNQQGVALNRMATISYGEDHPVAPNNTRAGRAQNRRVVLVVLD